MVKQLTRSDIPEEYLNDVAKWCEIVISNEVAQSIEQRWDADDPLFQVPLAAKKVEKPPDDEDEKPQSDRVIATANEIVDGLVVGGVPPGVEIPELEEDPPSEEFSKPDLREFKRRRRKRKRHPEVSPEDKSKVANGYAAWWNTNCADRDDLKIRAGWKFELDSKHVVYISIDAVYVSLQDSTHVKGGKEYLPEERPKISHWNITVEYRDKVYIITDTYLPHAMIQLLAFILENRLYKLYFIFFTDGEQCIFDNIQWFFAPWKHAIFLDFFHATGKIFEMLSSALKSRRVKDPRGNHTYYVRGDKKGQIKKMVMTSLSRLYAREAARYLYVGNIPELIRYLEHIDPDDIQNPEALEKLINYFKYKGAYCTCSRYAA